MVHGIPFMNHFAWFEANSILIYECYGEKRGQETKLNWAFTATVVDLGKSIHIRVKVCENNVFGCMKNAFKI